MNPASETTEIWLINLPPTPAADFGLEQKTFLTAPNASPIGHFLGFAAGVPSRHTTIVIDRFDPYVSEPEARR